MKPYAVSVTVGQKVSGKEFDTLEQMQEFLKKAEELKKKAPTLLVRIIRNGLKPKPKRVVQPTIILNEGREECKAWIRVYKDGVPMGNHKNEQIYKCVPVPPKPKVFYCPYCHSYKDWVKVDLGYGNTAKGCECGVTENDFYIKTANSLWKGYK